MNSRSYRLRSSLTVLVEAPASEKPSLRQLQPGETINIQGEPRPSGLVAATTTAGETVTFFFADLDDRAERIRSAEA